MATQLLAARFMAKADYGWWVLGSTLIGYIAFSQLGTSSALSKVVPELVAVGNTGEARRARAVATVHSIVSGVIGMLVLVAVTALGNVGWGMPYGIALGALFLTQQMANTRLSSLIARQDRVGAGVRYLLVAIAMATAGTWGALHYGKEGLAAAFAIAWFFAAFELPDRGDTKASRPAFVETWWRLVRTGVPITVAGTLFLLVISLDRLVVAQVFDLESAGVYGLASVAAGGVFVFQQAVSTLFLPRLAHDRARGASGEELRATAARLSAIVFRLSLLCLAGFLVLFPLLIRFVLPEYSPSVAPALVLAVGLTLFSLSAGESNLLLAEGANVTYGAVLARGAVLVGFASIVAAVASRSLVGVAAGSSVAYGLTALMLRHATTRAVRGAPTPGTAR